MKPDAQVQAALAPHGRLRVGLNMANFLLITGTTASGEPDGVSPDIGRKLAQALGVAVEFVRFDGPGQVADAASDDVWDVANIANEPARAETIDFSPAYCEIQASFLVKHDAGLHAFADVDKPGRTIAVKARSAYELWLSDHLRHAALVRTESMEESYGAFVDQELDALAGLRPKLLEYQQETAGTQVMQVPFTAVKQSMGIRRGTPEAAIWLAQFVKEAVVSGVVNDLIEHHGVGGRLSVPPH